MSAFYPDEQHMAYVGAHGSFGNYYHQPEYSQPVTPGYSPSSQQQGMPQTTMDYSQTLSYVPSDQHYSSTPLTTFSPQSFWSPTTSSAEDPLSCSTCSYVPTSAPSMYHDVVGGTSPVPSYSSQASRSPSSTSVTGFGSVSYSENSRPDLYRSPSGNASDLHQFGFINDQRTWSCAFPGCTSKAVFTRGCDLRKHYKRHTKSFFCRHEGCPQATGGGFSSKKDLARHEAKHNPGVMCDWTGCDRVFSRVDNMRDHVKRIHLKVNGRSSASSA